jgi:hypothetical protein
LRQIQRIQNSKPTRVSFSVAMNGNVKVLPSIGASKRVDFHGDKAVRNSNFFASQATATAAGDKNNEEIPHDTFNTHGYGVTKRR